MLFFLHVTQHSSLFIFMSVSRKSHFPPISARLRATLFKVSSLETTQDRARKQKAICLSFPQQCQQQQHKTGTQWKGDFSVLLSLEVAKHHCWGTKTTVSRQNANTYKIHANLWLSTRRTSCHCTVWAPISLSNWQDFFCSHLPKQLFTSEGVDSSHLETVEKNNKYEASSRNHNVLK